ncbi:MAG TPA: TIGR04282 family arsenosugar biosynthesis glycosyltransferase [Stellaceae bacterium]|nr:TIGR04282 family arsenosugar biosynthesis glycosyltransferase [Stellaceae bacterium]
MSDAARFCGMAVMAKAPRVGDVKTRLVPPLSAAAAAALGGAFLKDAADNILAAATQAPIDGYVAYSPAGSEELFRAILPRAIRLLPPRHAGLAASLLDATADLLALGHRAVCLVNADSPNLPTAALVAAVEALAPPGDRLVLGPAEDGGYWLIGLKAPHGRLFENIAWSTDAVLGQTRERAASLGLDTVLLPSWYDVDDLSGLRRLAAELQDGVGYPARHTAEYLRGLLAEDAGRCRLAAERTASSDKR